MAALGNIPLYTLLCLNEKDREPIFPDAALSSSLNRIFDYIIIGSQLTQYSTTFYMKYTKKNVAKENGDWGGTFITHNGHNS